MAFRAPSAPEGQPLLGWSVLCLALVGCAGEGVAPGSLDQEARRVLAEQGVTPLEAPPPQSPAMVALGQALMFDRILSGRKDVACGTCHSPVYHLQDALTLSIGTGGTRSGPVRQLPPGGDFIPRSTPELFNRGTGDWRRFFADGRVADENGAIVTPAGALLPPVANLLTAQAMIPVTVRVEMRGEPGSVDVFGQPNELAALADDDYAGIWAGLQARLMAIPEYQQLFADAFPGIRPADLGFQHAAQAIAAFIATKWFQNHSPFDQYLRGEAGAMSDAAKRGLLLFFGKARCGACHSGSLLTDQEFHNVGIPDIGPGVDGTGRDPGRARVTGDPADAYRFRTPPLRNVVLTGPYMHDGAFATLEEAVRHYRDVTRGLLEYDARQLDARLQGSVHQDGATTAAILATLDTAVVRPLDLDETEIDELMAFLVSLTDPDAVLQLHDIPTRVPSGLPVF